MNIASERIDELARRLARVTGEDVETAVERAIAERLSRLCVPSAEDRRAALQEFFDLAAWMPTNDTRSVDEIIGYGPDGLPRVMILDTSAIIAAIAEEPEGVRYRTAIQSASSLAVVAITVLETRIVLYGRRQALLAQAFDVLLQRAGIEVVPLDAELAHSAFEAFRRYGKGQGHPAQLNIVDCASMPWRSAGTTACCSRVTNSPGPI